ncbi:uncharacterized protein LOC144486571 [Mustelus asterias]
MEQLLRNRKYQIHWIRRTRFRAALRVYTSHLIHEANTTYYKVGHSKNPTERCRGLQTGNPRQLTREHEVRVRDKEAEGRVLEALQEYKADLGGGTKWFRLDTKARVNEAKAAMNNEKWPDLLH